MINIYIAGPGGCVDFEAELVIRALQQVGYMVEVETNWVRDVNEETTGVFMARRTKLIQDRLAEGKPSDKIKVKIDHLPWGG